MMKTNERTKKKKNEKKKWSPVTCIRLVLVPIILPIYLCSSSLSILFFRQFSTCVEYFYSIVFDDISFYFLFPFASLMTEQRQLISRKEEQQNKTKKKAKENKRFRFHAHSFFLSCSAVKFEVKISTYSFLTKRKKKKQIKRNQPNFGNIAS